MFLRLMNHNSKFLFLRMEKLSQSKDASPNKACEKKKTLRVAKNIYFKRLLPRDSFPEQQSPVILTQQRTTF